MTTLILWDIDGTLISSGGAGMRALRAALKETFGIDGSLEDIEFAGRTDRWIMRRVFAKFGIEATEPNFAAYAETYFASLPREMAAPGARVLPGVRRLLEDAASRPGAAQGLLTGNLRRGAQAKLGHHGLWDYFPFGAFADDGEQRNDLGPHALRRARERHGVDFAPGRTWVVGDTPHDIASARAFGANSLAVATGSHSQADLAAHHPTVLLPDLSDPTLFWSRIDPSA
jgi:phosphoglycolate phosphatase